MAEGKINSRKKGAKGEKEASKLLEDWVGKKFARVPSSGGLQWQASMAKGDIVCTEEGFFFPFCMEIKNYAELQFQHLLMNSKSKIVEFWEQCKRDALIAKKVPMLWMRYNGLPKGLFFVVVERTFYEFCIAPFYTEEKRAMAVEGKHDFVIFTTYQLFEVPYKRMHKIARNYAANYHEIIKPLKEYPGYELSNRGYILKPNGTQAKARATPKNPYLRSTVKDKSGKSKMVNLHQLVAKYFVKNPKNGEVVNHLQNDRTIADARNLEWTTQKENVQHAYENINPNYRIKQWSASGELLGSYRSISLATRAIGENSPSTINRVINGKRKTAYGFRWTKEMI